MADTKISALPTLTTLADADIIPVSQGGTTKGALASTFKTYIGGGVTSRVSGSDFTLSSGTLTDITGLTFAASANKLYEVDVVLDAAEESANSAQFSIAYSASGAVGTYNLFANSNASTAVHSSNALGSASASCFGSATQTHNLVFIKAIVAVGANTGNITVKILGVGGSSTRVRIGSRMTVTAMT